MTTREQEIHDSLFTNIRKRTDRMFVWVFAFQWALALGISLLRSPLTWSGETSSINPHVWMALFIGAALSIFPILKFILNPGAKENGLIAAVVQMGYSTLLVHITGGRIETHFHIFGSLAFLTFYRDPWVILTATVMTAVDHIGRGAFLPMSIYGVADASLWRAIEHACWVVFEDIFLLVAVNNMRSSMISASEHMAKLENAIANTERTVEERTRDLKLSQQKVIDQ